MCIAIWIPDSQRLPDVGVMTEESVLSMMLKEGRIEKIGEEKGARYRMCTV